MGLLPSGGGRAAAPCRRSPRAPLSAPALTAPASGPGCPGGLMSPWPAASVRSDTGGGGGATQYDNHHARTCGAAAVVVAAAAGGTARGRRGALVVVACLTGGGGGGSDPVLPTFAGRHNRRRRRSSRADTPAPASTPSLAGGLPSGGGGGGSLPNAASSPVPPPTPSGGGGSGGGGGVTTCAVAVATAVIATTVDDVSSSPSAAGSRDGSQSDYEGASEVAVAGNHIVPFARRQPRALVLDCAYRPINVLTWYRAFHFDYFGKGEVLEYYPAPAVCTTGSGDFPLPAVIRVPQYTADMQDLCSRVACSRRNVMVRDGFCCQYCGSRRDLTIDHVHPVSKGGKDAWENLVTACMKCNQRKSDRTLRELGWKLRRQPKEPSPYEIGIVAGIATADILRPPPEWEAYIQPYKERLEGHRRAAVEAGLLNLIDDDDG